MSADGSGITRESELCRILPCLQEKWLVDFANGIDVSRDHQRVQRGRSNIFDRLLDGLTGKGARRQGEVNAGLIDGVEASLTWLVELTGSLANSNLAIAQVNDRVNELKLDVARIAEYSADTRSSLNNLANRLDERCDALAEDLRRVDFVQRVQIHLDAVLNKWRAGRYAGFSLSGRCYAALEELRWGAFGDYCRSVSGHDRQRFLDDLANRIMAQLAADAGVSVGERMGTRNQWLRPPGGRGRMPDADEALAYLGDWSTPSEAPFVFSTSQMPDELPVELPRVSSAGRVSEAMVHEVFERDGNG